MEGGFEKTDGDRGLKEVSPSSGVMEVGKSPVGDIFIIILFRRCSLNASRVFLNARLQYRDGW
jgi:hypothetical protein